MNTIKIIDHREFPNSNFVWEMCVNGPYDVFERIYGVAAGHNIQVIKDHDSNLFDVVIDGEVESFSPSEQLQQFTLRLVRGDIR